MCRAVVDEILQWLVTHIMCYHANHGCIDQNACARLPQDGNLSNLASVGTSHSPVAIHSMRGQRSTSTEEGACSALHDMLDMCWAVCERRQPHLKAQSLEVTSPQHKQPLSVSYFTVVSESDCSCTDGVQQPIVRVHKPRKAFLEGTLVFSSSPSEHQAALFATL